MRFAHLLSELSLAAAVPGAGGSGRTDSADSDRILRADSVVYGAQTGLGVANIKMERHPTGGPGIRDGLA